MTRGTDTLHKLHELLLKSVAGTLACVGMLALSCTAAGAVLQPTPTPAQPPHSETDAQVPSQAKVRAFVGYGSSSRHSVNQLPQQVKGQAGAVERMRQFTDDGDVR